MNNSITSMERNRIAFVLFVVADALSLANYNECTVLMVIKYALLPILLASLLNRICLAYKNYTSPNDENTPRVRFYRTPELRLSFYAIALFVSESINMFYGISIFFLIANIVLEVAIGLNIFDKFQKSYHPKLDAVSIFQKNASLYVIIGVIAVALGGLAMYNVDRIIRMEVEEAIYQDELREREREQREWDEMPDYRWLEGTWSGSMYVYGRTATITFQLTCDKETKGATGTYFYLSKGVGSSVKEGTYRVSDGYVSLSMEDNTAESYEIVGNRLSMGDGYYMEKRD